MIEQPDPDMRWRQPVERLALAVAAVMAAVGLYLIDPGLVDLGPGVQPGRTGFIGAFLLAAGFVLAVNVAWPKDLSSGSVWLDVIAGFAFGKLALYGFAVIEVVLGARALMAVPPQPWVALLLVPGLATLAAASVGARLVPGRRSTGREPVPSSPESGRIDPGATVLGALTGVIGVGLVLSVAVIGFAWGLWLYKCLDAVLFGQKVIPLAAAGASLWELTVVMAPRALFVIGLAALWMAVLVAWSLLRWLSRRAVPDVERDLTAAEVEYIDTSAAEVTAYARDEGYVDGVWLVIMIGVVFMVALFFAGATWVLPAMRPAPVPPGGALLPLEVPSGGFAPIVGVFVVILLSGLPNSILSRLSGRHAERSGWTVLATGGEFISLHGRLNDLVRRRLLRPEPPIDPAAFLRATSRWYDRSVYGIAAVLAALLLFLAHRDREAVDVVTADSIELTSYWTLQRERYRYSDVRQVELRCHLTDKGEAVVAYELQLAGGRARNIYKEELFMSRLPAYEAVGTRLADEGVPFVPGAHRGRLKDGEPGYEPDCVRQVAAGFPEDLRDRVTALFHLDELAAVDEIWPWDPGLAHAKAASARYEIENALRLYTEAIDSGRLPAHLLASAYAGRGRARDLYEQSHGMRDEEMLLALRDYQRAGDIEPDSMTYYRQGWALKVLGAYDEAASAYRRALELERPTPHWSLIGLAVVERIQGRHDEAMGYLDEALRRRGSGSNPIHFHRAMVRALQQDDAGVVEEITRGLEYEKDFSPSYHHRACAYARLSDFAAARADIERALEIYRGDAGNPWLTTPQGKNYQKEQQRDRQVIDAMAAGTASEAERQALCQTRWNVGDERRPRSALLPSRDPVPAGAGPVQNPG